MHKARSFEQLLDAHPWPHGSRWTVQKLDEATGGVVARTYFTDLGRDA